MNKQPAPQRTVTVVPYQDHWPQAFACAQVALLKVLGSTALALHHIGSTAVPGLAAKPILDLLLEVTDLAALDNQTAVLAALGYVGKGENGIAGRRYFYKNTPPESNQRSHHLHVLSALHRRSASIWPCATICGRIRRLSQNTLHSNRHSPGNSRMTPKVIRPVKTTLSGSCCNRRSVNERPAFQTTGPQFQPFQGLPPGAAVSDLGCGSGLPLSKALAARGFDLDGIDASPTLAATAGRASRLDQSHVDSTQPARRQSRTLWLSLVVVILGGGYLWWSRKNVRRAGLLRPRQWRKFCFCRP